MKILIMQTCVEGFNETSLSQSKKIPRLPVSNTAALIIHVVVLLFAAYAFSHLHFVRGRGKIVVELRV